MDAFASLISGLGLDENKAEATEPIRFLLEALPSNYSAEVFGQLRKAPRLDILKDGHWRARPDTQLHATAAMHCAFYRQDFYLFRQGVLGSAAHIISLFCSRRHAACHGRLPFGEGSCSFAQPSAIWVVRMQQKDAQPRMPSYVFSHAGDVI